MNCHVNTSGLPSSLGGSANYQGRSGNRDTRVRIARPSSGAALRAGQLAGEPHRAAVFLQRAVFDRFGVRDVLIAAKDNLLVMLIPGELRDLVPGQGRLRTCRFAHTRLSQHAKQDRWAGRSGPAISGGLWDCALPTKKPETLTSCPTAASAASFPGTGETVCPFRRSRPTKSRPAPARAASRSFAATVWGSDIRRRRGVWSSPTDDTPAYGHIGMAWERIGNRQPEPTGRNRTRGQTFGLVRTIGRKPRPRCVDRSPLE